MRLTRLCIEKYGCFDRAELEFAAEPGRINLVVAPNGAGKSVLRQAFHDLLFDIPLRSPMAFRFGGYKGMALRASAVDEDGAAFDFAWVRQSKPPRVTNDAARYAKLRAACTPEQLEQLYALDTARLREGGTDLKGGATLAEALLSGTGELGGAHRVREDIKARMLANWTPGAQKPPLNAALGALGKARVHVKAAVQPPVAREREEQALDTAKAALDRARAAQTAARAEARRLNRIALVRPHLAELHAAEAWLAEHAGTPALPAGLDTALSEARMAREQAAIGLRLATEGEAQAAARVAEIVRDPVIQPHAAALAVLQERLGKAEDAARDSVAVRASWVDLRRRMADALRGLGRALPESDVEALLPPLALLTRARLAIRRHDSLAAKQAADGEALRLAGLALAAAEASPACVDMAPEGLEALVAEIRADGNPVKRRDDAARALRVAEADLAAALAAVAGWRGEAAELRALVPAGETSFERLAHALAALIEAARRDADAHAELETTCAKVAGRLGALRQTDLPDAASIAAARARRDLGWRLIHRRAFSPDAPEPAAEAAFAGDEPLPLAFERSLRTADDLADRRIAELDRVSEAERLTGELAGLRSACATADAKASASAGALAACREEWANALAPLGLEGAATIADVRRFLASRLTVVAALRTAEIARGAVADVQEAHDAWAGRLASTLGVARDGGLPALLAQADARLKAAADSQSARLVWQTKRAAAVTSHREKMDSLSASDGAMRAWHEDWAETLVLLGRPAGELPEETEAVLKRLEDVEGDRREASSLAERIDGMRITIDQFREEIAALAVALGEAAGADAFVIARRISARWEDAKLREQESKTAAETLADRREVLRLARIAATAAEDRCRVVIAAAGAHDLDDAADRIAASAENTRQTRRCEAALAKLALDGNGLSRDALQAEVDAIGADAMADARDAAALAAEAADKAVEAALTTWNEHQAQFDAGADATQAVDALAGLATAKADFSRCLEEQMVLQVAARMLECALKAVRAEAGDGGLERLSAQFAAVTDGAYGVVLDEEDGATLHAVELRFPGEKKALDDLSEGTRDQLYLALRMLALQDQKAALPFIADDILQTFDDARTLATLRALVELSAHVQVIVLTHHAHVGELAGELGDCVRRQGLLF